MFLFSEFLEEAIQKCGGFCAKPVNIVSFRCDIIIFGSFVNLKDAAEKYCQIL